jgi:hypothetical protein
LLLAGVALFATLPAGSASPREIGVTSAVVPQATGTPPDLPPRVLEVGADVVADERIVTGAIGKTQLLFQDGSALTVGSNADLVLDEFVYDPGTGTGHIALSASKGLLRFVGGRISKTAPVAIRTPAATIGVRGGITMVSIGAASVSARFLFGQEMTVTANGETVRVTRPGFQVVVPDGGAPLEPTPIPANELADDLVGLEGGPEQGGQDAVSPADISGSQLGALGSGNSPGRIGPADTGDAPPPPSGESDTFTSIIASPDVIGGTTGDSDGAPAPVPVPIPPPTAGCPTSCIDNLSGRVRLGTSTMLGTTVMDQAINSDGMLVAGQSFQFTTAAGSYTLSAPDGGGEFAVSGATLPASFGSGPFDGTGFASAGNDFMLYELTGSQILIFSGVPASGFTPSTTLQAATYGLRDDFTLGGSSIPFIPQPLQVNLASTLSPSMTVLLGAQAGADRFFMAGNLLIDGTGASQGTAGSLLLGEALTNGGAGSLFLRGRMRGIVDAGDSGFAPVQLAGPVASADDAAGFDFFGSDGPRFAVLDATNVDTGDVTQSGSGILRSNGNVALPGAILPNVPALNQQAGLGLFAPAPGSGGDQRATRTLQGFVGGAALERDSAGTRQQVETFGNDLSGMQRFDAFTITTDADSNRIAATMGIASDFGGFGSSTTLGFGGAGRGGFLDNSTFAAVEQADPIVVNGNSGAMRGFLVTGDMVTLAGGALAGVSLCACAELQWGFLSAAFTDPGQSTYEIALAPWVAGIPATAAQVANLSGRAATYEGHVVANVVSGALNDPANATRYTAFGSVSIGLFFSAGSITVMSGSAMALDGATYALTDVGAQAAPEYRFTLSDGGSRSGTGQGAVFGTTGFGNAAGRFSISASPTTYQASGVYAADVVSTVP